MKRELVEIIFYLFFLFMCVIFLPYVVVGLIFKGFLGEVSQALSFSTYLGTFAGYAPFIIGTLFLPIFSIAKAVLLKKGEHTSELEKPKWFHVFTVSYLFSPEDGLLYYISEKLGYKGDRNIFRWTKSIFRIFIIGLIAFGWLYLLKVSFPAQMAFLPFSSTPQIVVQQVTPVTQVAFSIEPASSSETYTMMSILSFIAGIIAVLCAKFIKSSKENKKLVFYILAVIILIPLVMLLWGYIHSVAYGNSDISFQTSLMFGLLGSTFTILTGSFIWWYLFHAFNNLAQALVKYSLVNEDIKFLWLLAMILITIGYIVLEFYLRSKKKKIGEDTYFTNG